MATGAEPTTEHEGGGGGVGGGDEETGLLMPHRRTSSTKLGEKSHDERETAKMLSSSVGSGSASLFSPTKKKKGDCLLSLLEVDS